MIASEKSCIASPVTLASALKEFEQAPGSYALALRKPQIVFENLGMVLRMAAERPVHGWSPDESERAAAQRAARFFVRTAMLRPGSDHFTLLGLAPGFEPGELRDHYRMMIKLTHPDFKASGEAWPAEAASRINIANDTLSSSIRREAYSAHLAASRHVARDFSIKSVHETAKAHRPQPRLQKHTKAKFGEPAGAWSSRVKAIVLSGGAVVSVVLLLVLNPGTNDRSLSVRPPDGNVAPPANLKAAETLGSVAAGAAASPGVALDTARSLEVTSGNNTTGLPAPKSPVAAMAGSPLDLKVDASLDSNLGGRRNTSGFGASVRDLGMSPKPALDPEPVGVQLTEALAARDIQKPERAKTPPLVVSSSQQRAANARHNAPLPAIKASSSDPDPSLAQPSAPARAWAQEVANARASSNGAALVEAEASKPAGPPFPAFGINEVEPVMKQVIGKLQSGRGRNVVPLLAPEARNSEAVSVFVRSFQDELSGLPILEVKKTDLRYSEQSDKLVVDAVIELVIEDYPGSSALKTISIQALFANRGGEPVLTQLTHLPRRRGVR